MRTATTLKRLSILCAGALLWACADQSGNFTLPERAAQRQADDAYARARNFHLAHKYDDALRAYRDALQADPQHVNARNGLATVYAERRAFAQAIPIWRSLTEKLSMASGPDSAYLLSNLGYAYFLNGEYANAVATLEKACLLDPLNYRAWHHLGESLQKLGQEDRAQAMFRQAQALQQHDMREDLATAGGTASPPIEAAVKAGGRDQEWLATDTLRGGNGMLELRRVHRSQAAQAQPVVAEPVAQIQPVVPAPAPGALGQPVVSAPEPVALTEPVVPAVKPLALTEPVVPAARPVALPAPAAGEAAGPIADVTATAALPGKLPSLPEAALSTQVALLEIRNGNGVTGMAKALSGQIGDAQLKVKRLTNEKGFGVRQTRIEYQFGFRAAAQRLAQRFDNAALVEVSNCKKTDMRLVIGHDVARPKFALRPLATPAASSATLAALMEAARP
jgi:Tfp pilus assembly protein PilF